MVRKLIADEFRSIWRQWRSILLPGLLVLFISLITIAVNLPIISSLGQLTSTIAAVVIVAAVIILPIINYYRKFYGNQGYLTMTLPASGRQLYWSRFWSGVLWFLIAVGSVFIIAGLFSLTTDISEGRQLFTGIRGAWQAFLATNAPFYVRLLPVAAILLGIFSTVTQYAFVITKGSEARFHGMGRLGGPVIVYIITYLLSQAASIIGLLLIPLGVRFSLGSDGETITGIQWVAESSWSSLRNAILGIEKSTFTLGLGFVLTLVVLYTVYIFLTIRSIEQHTSLR